MDATIAYRQATLRVIEYLKRYGIGPKSCSKSMRSQTAGYSDYQVYLMLSCAPIQGHVGGLVDVSPSLFLQISFIHLSICPSHASLHSFLPSFLTTILFFLSRSQTHA